MAKPTRKTAGRSTRRAREIVRNQRATKRFGTWARLAGELAVRMVVWAVMQIVQSSES